MIVCAVQRDESFSPNSVDADKAILHLAAEKVVQSLQADIALLREDNVIDWADNNQQLLKNQTFVWLSMARGKQALDFLKEREEMGDTVINSSHGVENCMRSRLHKLMIEQGLPVAPAKGVHGYWLKRGDQAAQSECDVVFAENENRMGECLNEFYKRGVTDVVVTAHVPGDLIKFYGIAGTQFFRTYYPTADGMSKFGNETQNGLPHYYAYDVYAFQRLAERIATLANIRIYGGDAIVDEKGRMVVIDFNDWPSFSRCRLDAVEAISELVVRECKRGVF